jgi:midasin
LHHQIWVPAISDYGELLAILESRLANAAMRAAIGRRLLAFWQCFVSRAPPAARGGLSVRDLLAWVGFINAACEQLGPLQAYAHGAYLTLLDGLGLGLGIPQALLEPLRHACRQLLVQQLSSSSADEQQQQQQLCLAPAKAAAVVAEAAGELLLGPDSSSTNSSSSSSSLAARADVTTDDGRWGIPPFFVARGPHAAAAAAAAAAAVGAGPRFNFQAPTTCRNAFRLLRAMQVRVH